MTKQEKIIEAWGNDWSKLDDKAKDLLLNKNQGALVLRDFIRLISRDIDYDTYICEKGEFNSYVIPKSLQGIENNNGWIKIESEEDLPKEDGLYYLIRNNGVITWNSVYISNMDWLIEDVTHYQPIVKPKPPVY